MIEMWSSAVLVLDCKLNGTTAKSDMGMLKDSFAEKVFVPDQLLFALGF